MGIWKIRGELWRVCLGNGQFPLRYRHRFKHTRIAFRVVRTIQTRRAIRLQHDDDEDVDGRSCKRISTGAGARLPAAGAGLETDRVDWRKLVALGCGSCHRVSIPPAPS